MVFLIKRIDSIAISFLYKCLTKPIKKTNETVGLSPKELMKNNH